MSFICKRVVLPARSLVRVGYQQCKSMKSIAIIDNNLKVVFCQHFTFFVPIRSLFCIVRLYFIIVSTRNLVMIIKPVTFAHIFSPSTVLRVQKQNCQGICNLIKKCNLIKNKFQLVKMHLLEISTKTTWLQIYTPRVNCEWRLKSRARVVCMKGRDSRYAKRAVYYPAEILENPRASRIPRIFPTAWWFLL